MASPDFGAAFGRQAIAHQYRQAIALSRPQPSDEDVLRLRKLHLPEDWRREIRMQIGAPDAFGQALKNTRQIRVEKQGFPPTALQMAVHAADLLMPALLDDALEAEKSVIALGHEDFGFLFDAACGYIGLTSAMRIGSEVSLAAGPEPEGLDFRGSMRFRQFRELTEARMEVASSSFRVPKPEVLGREITDYPDGSKLIENYLAGVKTDPFNTTMPRYINPASFLVGTEMAQTAYQTIYPLALAACFNP